MAQKGANPPGLLLFVRRGDRRPGRSSAAGRRLLLLAALALAAAGCAPERAVRDGRTEVVFWHMWTGEWEEVVGRIIARFNASQDRIRVRPLVVTGDANTKLLLALAGGDPPDIMAQWNQVIPAWAHKRALVPLDTLMPHADYAQMRRWLYPAAREIGTYDGHLYAVCVALNSHCLLLNTRMVREAGLDPARPPRTIHELDRWAAGMFRRDPRGKLERVGFLPTGLQHWAAVFGGELYDPLQHRITANDPRVVQALDWMVSYSRQYDVNRIVSFQAGLTQQIGSTYPFIGRKFAMLADGQWRVEDMRKFAPGMEYAVAPLPYPPGGRPNACWVNGNSLIVPRGARHPREALEFARYWCGWKDPAAAAEIATWGGWIPASAAITREPAYQEYLRKNPHFRTFLEVAASPNVRTTPPVPVQAFYWDRLQAAEDAALRLEVTPRAALDQVTFETQRELDRVLKRGAGRGAERRAYAVPQEEPGSAGAHVAYRAPARGAASGRRPLPPAAPLDGLQLAQGE